MRIIYIYIYFYILTCLHKGREMRIQICDISFIRRGLQPIELLLEDKNNILKQVEKIIENLLLFW
jgi:hypothetical protein